jgi:hypothetical protein
MASAYVPDMQVLGVMALSPPTDLAETARQVLAEQNLNFYAVMNLLIAAGSWHRLYGLDYPRPFLTDAGIQMAEKVSDPDMPLNFCYNPGRSTRLRRPTQRCLSEPGNSPRHGLIN